MISNPLPLKIDLSPRAALPNPVKTVQPNLTPFPNSKTTTNQKILRAPHHFVLPRSLRCFLLIAQLKGTESPLAVVKFAWTFGFRLSLIGRQNFDKTRTEKFKRVGNVGPTERREKFEAARSGKSFKVAGTPNSNVIIFFLLRDSGGGGQMGRDLTSCQDFQGFELGCFVVSFLSIIINIL